MYRRPPSFRKNQERRRLWIAIINRVPVYICISYFFVFSPTVEKVHVGRKIALASVHRLAEHLHAMSTQKSIYKISDYSQARSSVPPKIPLMYLLFKSWTVGSCGFQIHPCVHSCMRNEPQIAKFTRDSVTKFLPAQFPWIWCKSLLRHLIHSKIFNLTKCREVLLKYSLLITHTGMPI